MKKTIIWLAIIALLAVLGGYIYYKATEAHADPLESDQLKVDSKELFRMFENFEDSANKTYAVRDKAIAVSGKIESVELANNFYKVNLESGSDMGLVICEMDASENDKVKDLKAGTEVEIIGFCNGYLMDVNLFRCKLAK